MLGSRRMPLLVAPGVAVPDRELKWAAVRASGPGGQNVNKVSSKVELRFDFEVSTALSQAVKARLRKLAEHRLDREGRVVIVSQATRNQAQNLGEARARLAALIASALVVPKRRRPTGPTRAAERARVQGKRLLSKKKQIRSQRDGDD